jgi:hypothetical protein
VISGAPGTPHAGSPAASQNNRMAMTEFWSDEMHGLSPPFIAVTKVQSLM